MGAASNPNAEQICGAERHRQQRQCAFCGNTDSAGIIKDTQVVALDLVGRGQCDGRFRKQSIYWTGRSSGRMSPAVTGVFKGQLTIKMLDWTKHDLGYLPGKLMSHGQDNMVTPSVMLGHELRHARAWMTGYDRRVIRPSREGSLRLEKRFAKSCNIQMARWVGPGLPRLEVGSLPNNSATDTSNASAARWMKSSDGLPARCS